MNKNEEEFSLNSYFIPFTTKKALVFIILVGIVVYFNSLYNGYVWDDWLQIVNNAYTHSFNNCIGFFLGLGASTLSFYRPLHMCTDSLLYTLFGPIPLFYHFFQVTIHIANACLLFILFNRFFKKTLAFILALLFLIHPINSEAVNYISALQEPLYFFFGTIALIILDIDQLTIKRLILGFILALCSLLTKESAILFLLIVNIFNIIYRKKNVLRTFLASCSIFGIFLLLRFFFANAFSLHKVEIPILDASPIVRLQTMPKMFFYYIKTFIFPVHLAISQDWLVKSLDMKNFYLPSLLDASFLLSILVLGIFLWKFRKNMLKNYIFFYVWFLSGIVIHLQIIPLDTTVAERWFYFSSAGLLGIIGIILSNLKFETKNSLIVLLVITIICALSIRTMIRNTNWIDRLTLYSHDVAYSDSSWSLESNLGLELFKSGKNTDALKHLQKSVELAPNGWKNWTNLASYYFIQNDYSTAERYFKVAIKNNPNYQLSYDNYGSLLSNHGDQNKAKNYLENSLKKFTQDGELWYYLALVYYKMGLSQKALQAAKHAYAYAPNRNTEILYSHLLQNIPMNIDSSKSLMIEH